MNTQTTLDFIELYPNFDKCLIQVFDDVETRKDKKLAQEAIRWGDGVLSRLGDANKKWCWVFFSINQIEGKQRIQSAVSWVNARVCEMDWMSKEIQATLIDLAPLKPSLVVDSKRSFQVYYFAKDGTLANWRKIMWGLRNFYEGDHRIITEERVLRLPWFYHQKDPKDKYFVDFFEVSKEYYTEAEMLLAFPDTVNKLEQSKSLKQYSWEFSNDDGFWKRACSVNAEYMLWLLSWSKWVNGEKIDIINKQIWINEKQTGSWIDDKGMIGSYDKWWPTRIQWVSWYGTVDWKELYQWTIQKLPELKPIPKIKEKNEVIAETKQELDDFFVPYNREHDTDYTAIVPFTRGNKSVDDYFGRLERGRFMTTIGESWSGKTTRAFHQWIEISKSYKVLFISLEMNGERVIELRARKMAWISQAEWNDKIIIPQKIEYMEKMKKEITNNASLEIVGVNTKAKDILVDNIVIAIEKKYMNYDWIIIDNLGFIKGNGRTAYEEINDIVRKLKEFCHRNNKNINLLHHFNKGSTKARSERDRTFADVLGSGKLEHDVDYWVFISRYLDKREELNEEQKQEVYIKLAKDRDNGEIKKKSIYFYKWRYYNDFQSNN